MHFTIEQEDATTVFRLKEARLDSANASQLKAEFLILAQSDVEVLILDLAEVGYVDSAGLSALLLAERQMAAHGGEVRLVGVHENVKSLLGLTQLDRLFPMFDTVDAALDAEPSFGDDEDDEVENVPTHGALTGLSNPGAPTASAIRAGAIAAGGSLGAAVIAKIMMTPYNENADEFNDFALVAYDEDDDFDEEDEDDDLDEIEEDDIAESEAGSEAEEGAEDEEPDDDDLDEEFDDEDDLEDIDDLDDDEEDDDDDF